MRGAGGGADGCATSPSSSVYPSVEQRSRLDYQFYSSEYTSAPSCVGPFIMGMPGCKSAAMCSDPIGPLTGGTGRFALSNPSMSIQDRPAWPTYRYNVKDLTFNPGINLPTSQCR